MEITLPKNHITYTSSHAIKSICSPIIRHFDISHFNYVRLFHDGDSIRLTMNPAWVEFFYKKYSHYFNTDGLTEIAHHESFLAAWSQLGEKLIFADLASHFEVDGGLVIADRNRLYTEFFFYGLQKASHITDITLINNADLLKKFNEFFLTQAAKLISEAKKNPIKLPTQIKQKKHHPTHQRTDERHIKLEFLNEICGITNHQKLTKRERSCAHYTKNGLSSKETARQLGISHRTVEHHLACVKRKLNVKKSILISSALAS